jgi:hypothetical protein
MNSLNIKIYAVTLIVSLTMGLLLSSCRLSQAEALQVIISVQGQK